MQQVANIFGNHALRRFSYAAAKAAGAEALAELDADLLNAVDQHGFAVLEHACPAASCERLIAEMRPYIDATPHGLHGLGGTRRTGALVARSPTSHEMIAHPAILRLVKSVLGEQRLSGTAVQIGGRRGKGKPGFRYPWHLHLTQIIDVGPGGGSAAMPHQLKMHRANGMWVHDFQHAELDLQVEVMWALTDFTAENGATHVVLGSHGEEPSAREEPSAGEEPSARECDGLAFARTPRGGTRSYSEPTIQAAMPCGSALIWTGWSVHGAGVNTSNERRVGMNINYALGFLVQEENQFLACPPHLARKLPVEMQRLLGYRQPSGSLNYVAECQAPADSVLREDFDVLVPGAHGHAMDASIDGPAFAPASEDAYRHKLEHLEVRKAQAIAADDLEQALHLKHAISILRRSPRL